MWQNLEYVAMDVGEHATAIQAARRIIQLDAEGAGARHEGREQDHTLLDIEVLLLLVKVAVALRAVDLNEGQVRTPLLQQVHELLHVCDQQNQQQRRAVWRAGDAARSSGGH